MFTYLIYGNPPIDSSNLIPEYLVDKTISNIVQGDYSKDAQKVGIQYICISDIRSLQIALNRIQDGLENDCRIILLTDSEYGLTESQTIRLLLNIGRLAFGKKENTTLYLSKNLESSGIHYSEIFDNLRKSAVKLCFFNEYTDEKNINQLTTDFKDKLIKRIGLFARGVDQKTGCKLYDRHYYDAANCTNELIEIIDWFLRNKIPKSTTKLLILYDGKISGWLKNIGSFQTFRGDFVVGVQDINVVIKDKQSNVLSKFDYFLCLYPVKNTGQTIRFHVEQLNKINKKFDPNINVQFLSLLLATTDPLNSTEYNNPRVESRRKIPGTNFFVELHYFLEVDKGTLSFEESQSIHNILQSERVQSEQLEYHELFSYEYWYFVQKYGLLSESDVPNHRKKQDNAVFQHVPNFERIFQDYSPYLSEKIIERLRVSQKQPIFEYSNSIIVTPDESTINSITNSLSKISTFDLVKVPREVINRCDSEYVEKQLKGYLASSVIILDCFTRTGETLNKLSKIIKSLKYDVIERLVIFSYLHNQESPEHITSLYQIPILASD